MANKKQKGLGRGLDALLGGPSVLKEGDANTPTQLPLDILQAGKYQPRTRMDEGALNELAASIKAQGVMQPLLVRPLDKAATRYEIIAGERRFRAARMAGINEVPVLVKQVDDQTAAAMALIENMQREDLNPLEEARGIARLINEFKFTHETAANALGRSRSAVTNLLRLINLATPVQIMLLAGDLDMGHARALLSVEGTQQITLANQVVAKCLSVRETEKLVSKSSQAEKPPHQLPKKSRDLIRLEEELSDLLATEVHIKMLGKQNGTLLINFANLDNLEGILDRVRTLP